MQEKVTCVASATERTHAAGGGIVWWAHGNWHGGGLGDEGGLGGVVVDVRGGDGTGDDEGEGESAEDVLHGLNLSEYV